MGSEVAFEPMAVAASEPEMMGEPEFEAFYRRTFRPLWGYLQRMTGDGAAADDLAQKAFIQFLRTPLTTREESKVRGLLYRIATNLAIDEIRRLRREREGWLGRIMPFAAPPDPGELRRDLGRAFEQLKPRERSLLWLAHVEGFEHREIAAVIGVEEGSVKVLLFRARKRLAGILQKMGLGPEVIA